MSLGLRGRQPPGLVLRCGGDSLRSHPLRYGPALAEGISSWNEQS